MIISWFTRARFKNNKINGIHHLKIPKVFFNAFTYLKKYTFTRSFDKTSLLCCQYRLNVQYIAQNHDFSLYQYQLVQSKFILIPLRITKSQFIFRLCTDTSPSVPCDVLVTKKSCHSTRSSLFESISIKLGGQGSDV
jgi:hypothetical protein